MITESSLVQTTGVWELLVEGELARLYRPATQDTLELQDVDARAVVSVFERLAAGCQRHEALTQLGRFDAEPEATLQALREQAVLREGPRVVPASVEGTGPLAEVMRESIERRCWRIEGRLSVFEAARWEEAARSPATPATTLTRLGDSFLAINGCPGCLVLRGLGRLLAPGQGPSALWPRPEALVQASLVSELLMELERAPLEHGEGLWVAAGIVRRGQVIAHPDCVRSHPAVDRSHAAVRAALAVPPNPQSAAQVQKASHLFVESPFAPVRLYELADEPGDLPLDVPFVWGDTQLVRHRGGVTQSVSIEGIVHGGGATAAECRRISICEAVERLGAQSARPDVWREGVPFCHGLDLLRDEACLVPFERVVVGLSAELAADLSLGERGFTGAATHLTLADAVLHASVEIIKRDAFMVAWYRKRRLRRIAWPTLHHERLAEQARFLRGRGFELELFDLTLDLPLSLVLLRVRATRTARNWPAGGALLVPAGGFDPHEALGHALKLACARVVTLCHSQAGAWDPCDPEAVARVGADVVFWPLMARYLDPATAEAHAFLGTGGTCAIEELAAFPGELTPARLSRLRAWLSERGIAWTAVRLTDPAAAAVGLEVVKVVMPDLMRLTLSREQAELDSPRLRLPLADATTDRPNPDPHPMY